ncbi:MAG: AbrB/MazE/SpoVT family DNA-binding domain-containing protein [Nanobdellota archaeon]
MERKIVKQGANTHTISLPADWVNQYGLTAGDILHVNTAGKTVIVSTQKALFQKHVRMSICGEHEGYIWRSILGLYKAGVDEIQITHQDQEELIERIAKQLLGFVIMEQDATKSLLVDISGSSKTDFTQIYKRCFQMLIQQSKHLQKLIERDSEVEGIEQVDYNLNQFTDYCLRYLSKHGHMDVSKTPLYYHILNQVEYIGDIMVRIGKVYTSSRQEHTLKILGEIHQILETLYLAAIKGDKKTIATIIEDCKTIRSKYATPQSDPVELTVSQIASVVKDLMNTFSSLHLL